MLMTTGKLTVITHDRQVVDNIYYYTHTHTQRERERERES